MYLHPISLLVLGHLLFLQMDIIHGARILGVFASHAHSHVSLGEVLLKGLAKNGHQVTMISPYPQRTPLANYTDVHLDGLKEIVSRSRHYLNKGHKTNYVQHVLELYNISDFESQLMLTHPAYKNLIESNQTFDVVILDFFANMFITGLCEHYKAHCVLVNSQGVMRFIQSHTGLHLPWSYVPVGMISFTDQMTFFQRVINVITAILFDFIEAFVIDTNYRRVYSKHFPNGQGVDITAKNFSLVLANSHIAIETPRPVLPIVKQVGGMHICEPEVLPKDIQEFLDNATHGAIYFSLGSNLRSTELPPHIVSTFLKIFTSMKQKVLWKWEEEEVPVQYSNIMFRKWFPQTDILAHPNMKLFITHGGMMSYIEAVARGVPLVGIPIFADQFINMGYAVRYGYGLRVLMEELSEDTLSRAIREVLNNPSYIENIKRGSSLLTSDPLKPLDTAIFWVEHILKYKGGNHMRAVAVDFPLYKIWMLDVWAFCIMLSICFYYIIIYLCSTCRSHVIKKKIE